MDSREEIVVHGSAARNADVAAVERVFERIAEADALAGIEELLSFSHEDLEMRAYSHVNSGLATGELLRGKDEVLGFFRRTKDSGYGIYLRPKGFDLVDDATVHVRGSIRVARPDGSFAESSVRWRFHFRDGLVDDVGWESRAGD